MRKIIFVIIALLCIQNINAQRLTKYALAATGCSYYSYCKSAADSSFSEDSSVVYTTECEMEKVTYGVICVKLKEAVTDLSSAEDLMISYADFLKSQFEISKSIGYGKGHHLKNDMNTRGIMDYWEDKSANSWKIKSWTNGSFISFLYAYSKNLPEEKVNLFLDGFRFPGM